MVLVRDGVESKVAWSVKAMSPDNQCLRIMDSKSRGLDQLSVYGSFCLCVTFFSLQGQC